MRNASKFTLPAAIAVAMLLCSDAIASTRDRLLSLVPADAVSVGMLRVDDMRRSPTAQTMFTKMTAGGVNAEAERLLREAGLKPTEDVDLVLVTLSPSSSPDRPRPLVAATGRFDPVRLGNVIASRGGMRRNLLGTTYFLAPENDVRPGEHPAFCFYDRGVVLAGTEDAVTAAIRTLRSGQNRFATTRLGREFDRIDPRASGWMLFDVDRARTIRNVKAPGAGPFGDQAYAALQNISTISLWVAETPAGIEFESAAITADDETRGLVADVLKGLLSSLRIAAQEKQPEMVSVIRRFDVDKTSDAVTLSGTVPAAQVNSFIARLK
jgi:hypothetical protein